MPSQGFSVMPAAGEGGKPVVRLLDEEPEEGTPVSFDGSGTSRDYAASFQR